MGSRKADQVITILLVDDIAELRNSIRKLLSMESDFEVVGMAGTGHEGLALAKELKPDIIIMDINMPDIDGLQVTTRIINLLPETGIIIMSAQDDKSYIRQAMVAGAKAFLTKPSTMDELYHTVRAVYSRARPQAGPSSSSAARPRPAAQSPQDQRIRAGNIIVVYSPQGGAGCTTIAINLAAELTRENCRVLLVDANLQFGDVGVFLNLSVRSTMVDLVEDVDDLDLEHFEDAITQHNSGLKVLMGPPRPELAEKVTSNPDALPNILSKIRSEYDFIVVDTSLHLDDMALSLMDLATRIILVSTPTLQSVKNVRFVLDLFEKLTLSMEKILLIFNRLPLDPQLRKFAITPEKAQSFLKQPVHTIIPADEQMMSEAIRKGIPVVGNKRDRDKSPVKELVAFADSLFTALMPAAQGEPSRLDGKPVAARAIPGKGS